MRTISRTLTFAFLALSLASPALAQGGPGGGGPGPGPTPNPWVVSGSAISYVRGGVLVGVPTGGSKGIGTINVSGGFYVNGTAVGGGVSSVSAGTGMAFTTITGAGAVAIDKATSANYFAATSNKVPTTDVIYPSEVTVTYGATTTFDMSTFINAVVTLTGNITTVTFSNIKAGQSGMITFIQDATGSRTVPATFNANFKFAGGTQPVLSTAASSVDVLFYACRTTSYCVASLNKAFN